MPFTHAPFLFNKVAVLGLGLIGSSMAKGLKERGLVAQIAGYDCAPESLEQALAANLVDVASNRLSEVLVHADLVVLAVPVQALEELLKAIKPYLGEQTILTDVSSVKSDVANKVEKILGAQFSHFILGHPIAGSELSGVGAADGDLFVRHKVILTPQAHTHQPALKQIKSLWQALGSEVEIMPLAKHDKILAATSHLPHLLAYTLVDSLARQDTSQEIFHYAAGGFRDFTRIAASSPIMWRDVFATNKTHILSVLDQYLHDLKYLRGAIENDDQQAVTGILTRAKGARDYFSQILTQRADMQLTTQPSVTFIASPVQKVQGALRVPGDKSISHRAIMLGSLAQGKTQVKGFLEGEDSLATLQAFRDMGVVIEGPTEGEVIIYGVGLHGLKAPDAPLYLGNSGTSMRLLAGLLSAQSFDTTLVGDESLSKRPMQRVIAPLEKMGAHISAQEGKPPLVIKGGRELQGIDYALPMASAQVKSCILLAGLYAKGKTSVSEPAPTRDHSERMLRGFGYEVSTVGECISLQSGGSLQACHIDVPADISSAAFFMVAASIAQQADVTLEHVGINPTRTGVIHILRLMGANIELLNQREVGGEPVADIRVQSAPLKGIQIPPEQVPLAIDEFPALFIAAACAEGDTLLTEAEELRVKESDRIQAMVDGLHVLGVHATATKDGCMIQGLGQNGRFNGGQVDSLGDHRIAMSFAIASLRANSPIIVQNCANVATSFPTFVTLANQAGLALESIEEHQHG